MSIFRFVIKRSIHLKNHAKYNDIIMLHLALYYHTKPSSNSNKIAKVYSATILSSGSNSLVFQVFPTLFLHFNRVRNNTKPKELDPELKIVSLSTFAISLLFAAVLLW